MSDHHSSRSGLGDGYYLRPTANGLSLLGGDCGFVLQAGAQLESSNSLESEFCLEALEMALSNGRKPQIFNSDQGCQFTSSPFVQRLKAEDIKISCSGRMRYFDNILVERLWRTVKYEEVYLPAYSDAWQAEISLARFF